MKILAPNHTPESGLIEPMQQSRASAELNSKSLEEITYGKH